MLDTNTCTLIPSTTVSETNGSETISCDTYYNAVKFTTSDISSNKNVSKAVFDDLAGSWTKEQNDEYSLNLVVDDLRAGVYNSSKVGAFVNSFKNIVGSNADVNIVSVPATLDKYLGNGGLTDIKDKHLSGAVLNGNKVDVSYIDLKAKGDDGLPAIKKFSVTLY